jgi:hypothetical protein
LDGIPDLVKAVAKKWHLHEDKRVPLDGFEELTEYVQYVQ